MRAVDFKNQVNCNVPIVVSSKSMDLLFALTYYRPHISGLTIYVQRIAEALAQQGHTITIITSRYNAALSQDEYINGVRIVRIPITRRISKGVVMPGYTAIAKRLIQKSDVCFLNLPTTPVEAIYLPILAGKAGKPIIGIYHCDLHLPPGAVNRIVNIVVNITGRYAAGKVDRIVISTRDYAESSMVLSQLKNKYDLIPPPICLPQPKIEEVEAFKHKYAPNGETLIGFAARLASEKGLEYLVQAIPYIKKKIPNLKVLFAGPYKNVVGEEKYRDRVMPSIKRLNDCWLFLDVLGDEMETFFAACDITVLPSVNRTESFGLVQVESMLSGTPVVASDLPGVRVPVIETGMGKLAATGNSLELAESIIEVLQNRNAYIRPIEEIKSIYSIDKTLQLYTDLINRVVNSGRIN